MFLLEVLRNYLHLMATKLIYTNAGGASKNTMKVKIDAVY